MKKSRLLAILAFILVCSSFLAILKARNDRIKVQQQALIEQETKPKSKADKKSQKGSARGIKGWNTDSSSSSSSSKSSSSTEGETKKELWNEEKRQKLADFMTSWSQGMNQTPYIEFDLNNNRNYGSTYIDWVTQGRLKVNEQQVSAEWSSTGEGTSEYIVVDGYAWQSDMMYTYLFAIKSGQPVVLFTAQRQAMPDNMGHFEITKNADLQAGWERIWSQ